MISGYAVAQVRAAEDRVRAGLPDGELMQRAARGLAHVVARRAAERGARRLVVLAGPGDNGGDALWAASVLAREGLGDDGVGGAGLTVVGVAERLHAEGLAAVRAAGIEVHLVAPGADRLPPAVAGALRGAHLVVDGLLGIGGRPGLRGAMAAVVDAVPQTAYLVAVDLPSGADPAGEEPLGQAVRADETVTFGMAKPVHLLPATGPAVGRLTVVDIGVRTDVAPLVERLEHADVPRLWPVPEPQDHKYSRGVLGVVAGSEAYPGAAVLTTTAAVESGAGMVRYLGPGRPTGLVLAACPEVVPGEGRVQALAVGPGIDPDGDDQQVDRVRAALGEDVPLVVDAGAVQLLAAWLDAGHRRPAPTLFTPHAGELAGLLSVLEDSEVTREQIEAAPLAHARRAAARTGCTVLLKGATTLVVDPDPDVPVRAQADAPAWLATAGAGDVLSGLAGVLLAAGLEPRDAGSLAALVHGVAADRANPGGPLRALAVARSIPSTVAALLAR
ncbi:MAG: bifunctional ADP-dependent (S)-NAD(P)H-hydrate dehydratase/NAD(P)H-hydrate epimerase [Acidobacteria bacterium]|nr:MAG: bifunctional ADP-dependent (S)-NAD(P)H-hydrate dehydratase/NAD(P)H-hydrate epimerase [Acidobacteriota bacterium]